MAAQDSLKITHMFVMLLIAVAMAAIYYYVPPVPQDLAYHNFADKRGLFGIPNFGDVMSNLAYLGAGIMGPVAVWKHWRDPQTFDDPDERYAVIVAFIGIGLVAFGSGYYHLMPTNATLMWDRLPMAIGFMGVFTMILTERLNVRPNFVLPFLVVGGASTVVYWHITEMMGYGDLRAYAMVQFFPILAIPFLLWLCPPRYTAQRYLWLMLAGYVAAKVFEHFDYGVFSITFGMMSGHTIKHLVSGWATYMLVRYIQERRKRV